MMFLTSSKSYLVYILLLFFILLSASCNLTLAQGTDLQLQGWFWQYPKTQGNILNNIIAFDKNTALAYGEFGVIIKTTDGGSSWEFKRYFENQDKLLGMSFLKKNRAIGWAVVDNVIWKTTDKGESWSVFKSDSLYKYGTVYFINPDTGWVLCDKGNVLKTINGGINWTTTTLLTGLSTPNFGPCFFIDDTTGWIAGYNINGIAPFFKTTDAGDSWTRITNISSLRIWYISRIHFIDKNTGWLLSSNKIIKTTDGGSSWISKEMPGPLNSIYFSGKDSGWAAGGKGTENLKSYIIRTTDGGNSWNELQVNSKGSLLSFDLYEGTGWAVGENGLIYKSSDNGESWTRISEEKFNLNSIHFADYNNGWAVGDSGAILHTTDSGLNWCKQGQSNNMVLNSVFSIDRQNAVAVGEIPNVSSSGHLSSAVILQTSDAGLNWAKRTYDSLGTFYSVTFTNNFTGWITAPKGTLLKTTDKGNTWEVRQINGSDFFDLLHKIQFIDESTGWVSVYGGNFLFKTTDKGESWSKQFIDSSFNVNSFCFADSKTGWIVGEHYLGNNLFKSTDGGNSWINKSIKTNFNLSAVYFVNESTGWILGYNSIESKPYILKSTDGGENWTAQYVAASDLFRSLFFFDEYKGFIAGSGIIKTNTGGTTSVVKEDISIVPETIKLYQNYPNPFNPTTTIQYRLSKTGLVSLKVYDILGRLVDILVDKWQNIGEYNVIFAADNLPSGVYLYTLTSGEFSQTKKLILLR